MTPTGFKECTHCHGHGSSLKDPEGVDQCTVCYPIYRAGKSPMPGLVPKGTEP